ncbi:hypothetical protein [Streptomyces sp. IBSBF 2435]|uniref:hypothetical protein n=1 Tax=Streptomyces sp. IBSBF 2435 TaxID=2903531 RepID=UPI002FDC402D
MPRLRRTLAVTAAAAAATAGGLIAGTPAQAATSVHCTATSSTAFNTVNIFPNFSASLSACDFADAGAPYHFTIDVATSHVVSGGTYVTYGLTSTCSSATALITGTLFAASCLSP